MRQEPVVISGARTTVNRTPTPSDEGESGRPKVNTAFAAIPEGKRIFQAKAGRYRIQLTAPQRVTFADGRIMEGDRAKVIQFQDYIAVLDKVKQAEEIKMLESHRDYKSDFWDLNDVITTAKKKRIEAAVALINGGDDEVREAIMNALTMGEGSDFEVPGKVQ